MNAETDIRDKTSEWKEATESKQTKYSSSGRKESIDFCTTRRRERQIGRRGRTERGGNRELAEAEEAAVKLSRVEALILSRLDGFIRSVISGMSTFRLIDGLICRRTHDPHMK